MQRQASLFGLPLAAALVPRGLDGPAPDVAQLVANIAAMTPIRTYVLDSDDSADSMTRLPKDTGVRRQKRRGDTRSLLHSLYHGAMNARRRTLFRVVTAAALAALAPARAFAARCASGARARPAVPTRHAATDGDRGPDHRAAGCTTPPPPPDAAPSAADLALKRVLRSSCRDGLDDVRAAGADPNTPWAATVARMCDDIVLEKKYTVTGGNEGRGRLVLWSSLYGIWLGIATDIMFEIDGDRASSSRRWSASGRASACRSPRPATPSCRSARRGRSSPASTTAPSTARSGRAAST